jgi:hypothetical protein
MDKMKFLNEVGAIIDPNGHILHITEGEKYLVVFPQQLLHDIHKKSPGSVYLLAHTHPPYMTNLSHEDITTLKAQALAMYPFPARMSTITTVPSDAGFDVVESVYLGFWEDKDSWRERFTRSDVVLPRKFTVVKEQERLVHESGLYNLILFNMSYSNEEETCLLSEDVT